MAQVENHNNFGTFKIEMVPEFNGKCDVANFIRDVNHIFDIHKPCEQLKVISLQNCIKGHALNAYHLTGGKLDTSDKLLEWIENRFGSYQDSSAKKYSRLMEKQKPGESVDELFVRFTNVWYGRKYFDYTSESRDLKGILADLIFGVLDSSIVQEMGEQFYSGDLEEIREKAIQAEYRLKNRPTVRFNDQYPNSFALKSNDWENPLPRHDYSRPRFRARRDSQWGTRHNYNLGNSHHSPRSNQTHQPNANQHFNAESPKGFPKNSIIPRKTPPR